MILEYFEVIVAFGSAHFVSNFMRNLHDTKHLVAVLSNSLVQYMLGNLKHLSPKHLRSQIVHLPYVSRPEKQVLLFYSGLL
jgi:hypothetical protein